MKFVSEKGEGGRVERGVRVGVTMASASASVKGEDGEDEGDWGWGWVGVEGREGEVNEWKDWSWGVVGVLVAGGSWVCCSGVRSMRVAVLEGGEDAGTVLLASVVVGSMYGNGFGEGASSSWSLWSKRTASSEKGVEVLAAVLEPAAKPDTPR